MEKLTIKHLAPYLPYGLEIKVTRTGTIEKLSSLSLGNALHLFKPLLRPLSDLTKEIEHNGEKFVVFKKLLEPHLKNGKHYTEIMYAIQPAKIYINSMPYHAMQKLFEWHFDVFNLLGNNLAVNYNDVYGK